MIKVKVFCEEDKELYDLRASFSNLFLGKFIDFARQHGVNYDIEEEYLLASAPQDRMQIFIDKLDCCGIEYEVVESN